MEKKEQNRKKINVNSNIKEVLDYLAYEFKPFSCQFAQHKAKYAYICLDKRC